MGPTLYARASIRAIRRCLLRDLQMRRIHPAGAAGFFGWSPPLSREPLQRLPADSASNSTAAIRRAAIWGDSAVSLEHGRAGPVDRRRLIQVRLNVRPFTTSCCWIGAHATSLKLEAAKKRGRDMRPLFEVKHYLAFLAVIWPSTKLSDPVNRADRVVCAHRFVSLVAVASNIPSYEHRPPTMIIAVTTRKNNTQLFTISTVSCLASLVIRAVCSSGLSSGSIVIVALFPRALLRSSSFATASLVQRFL